MKRSVRKILSLVLVVVLVLGMMGTALAAPYDSIFNGISWDSAVCPKFGTHKVEHQSAGGGLGFLFSCYCGATGYSLGPVSSDHTRHNLAYSADGDTGYHYVWCTLPGCVYADYELHNYYCTCGGVGTGTGTHNHAYTYIDASTHMVSCSYFSCPYYGGKIEFHSGTSCVCLSGSNVGTHDHQYVQVDATHHLVMCSDPTCYYYGGATESHSGYNCVCGYLGTGTGTGIGGLTWSNGSQYCTGALTPHTQAYNPLFGGYYCTKCYATATNYGFGTSTDTAVGAAGKLRVSAYDSMVDDTYSINETVTLSVSAYMWENNAYTSDQYDFYYAWSGDVSAYTNTNSDSAYLDTTGTTATAYCTVTAYPKGTTDIASATPTDTAYVYWTATAVATNDILYTALKGENVVLDATDFQEFWDEQYPLGELDYVRFTNVSAGNLYDNYAGGTTKRTDVRARSSQCYLDPAWNQIGLDDLTYVPTAYSNATTVTIQFTAYGTSSYTSYSNTSLIGTITILYTAKEVTPVSYETAGTSVALDSDDFIAKYKEVMGVTYAGNLSIQFLEAPAFGTLTLNAGTGYWGQTTGTKLTDTNIGNYTFSTSAAGTYSIDNLTYTPGKSADVIRFVCYSGNVAKFMGSVTFGAAKEYTVEIVTSAGKAVTFDLDNFVAADSTNMLISGSVYLGTPSAGTLYKNYANGTGTRVTSSDYFTASGDTSLETVTYVPREGYVGVVYFPFTAYTYLGEQLKGNIQICVGRNFADVAGTASAWAAPYINKLSAQGIVNGTDASMTKFSPTKTVTYGEALKLIMMAAGYTDQAKTGTHWASGFLTKAYYDGLVSSSAINLDAEVTRDTIAELTAKALKLGYDYSVDYGVTRPSDSTNGYVYALYNAGIINGVNVGASNYWYGSRSITRAEISKIICMVSDYEK